MVSRFLGSITMIACCCLAFSGTSWAEDPADNSGDHAEATDAIRDAAQRYTEALKRGDTAAMLSLWANGGDIVDEFGNSTPAKDMLSQEAATRAELANSDGAEPSIKIVDQKLRFLTPDVALEDGRVEVTNDGSSLPGRNGRFTAIWVKQDGAWRLASLREVRLPSEPAGELQALDWMVGKWKGQAGEATFEISAAWNDKHTYLVRDLVVTHDGKTILNGYQRVGVDPLTGHIRSWMHDADGGHGEGIWSHHGNSWVVQATGVSPDGGRTTGTNIYKPDGKDRFTWKSTGATVDGQSVPDFEIELQRVDESK